MTKTNKHIKKITHMSDSYPCHEIEYELGGRTRILRIWKDGEITYTDIFDNVTNYLPADVVYEMFKLMMITEPEEQIQTNFAVGDKVMVTEKAMILDSDLLQYKGLVLEVDVVRTNTNPGEYDISAWDIIDYNPVDLYSHEIEKVN